MYFLRSSNVNGETESKPGGGQIQYTVDVSKDIQRIVLAMTENGWQTMMIAPIKAKQKV